MSCGRDVINVLVVTFIFINCYVQQVLFGGSLR